MYASIYDTRDIVGRPRRAGADVWEYERRRARQGGGYTSSTRTRWRDLYDSSRLCCRPMSNFSVYRECDSVRGFRASGCVRDQAFNPCQCSYSLSSGPSLSRRPNVEMSNLKASDSVSCCLGSAMLQRR